MVLLIAGMATLPAAGQSWSWTALTIPVRDTNALAADRWSSETNLTAKPVILIQTPYNKDRYRIGEFPGFTGPGFPRSTNYHVVIVDWRGFYGSSNAAQVGYNRGLDGYDCVQWIATQTWCNGRVGTWGSSALGLIQYQTAAQQPPALASCTIQVKDFLNRYDNYYYGGVYRQEHVGSMAKLGLVSTNLILSQPRYTVFWQLAEANSDLVEDVAVPVLVVGGWYDHFSETVLRAYRDLRERGAPAAREKHRLIFGPWLHGDTGLADQGELTYPNATNLAADTVDFWDFTLRGVTNQWAQRPHASFYQLGEDIWVSWTSWTGVTRAATSLFLRADGGLHPAPAPTNDAPRAYAYNPADPTPALGGSRFDPFTPLMPIGPQDIAPAIESREDVLVFSTPPMDRPLRINGPLSATLYVSSDRTDTDFAVRLTDVHPDGRSLVMVQGIRRGRFRDSYSSETLMTPGEVYVITIPLQDLALTIRPGHRLRLVVSSAIHPHFALNRNDGGPMYTNSPWFVATNRIHFGPGQPSRIDFSTLPDDLDGDALGDFWESVHFRGLDRDGTGDFDGDGHTDAQEFLAGTDPTNAASVLQWTHIATAGDRLILSWASVSNRGYTVLTATNMQDGGFAPLSGALGLPATPPLNVFTSTAPAQPTVFAIETAPP